MRALLSFVILLSILAPAHAEPQVWTATFVQARLEPERGATAWLDLHARRRGGSTLYILRPALGWTFGPLAVYAGYASIPIDADEGAGTHEQRTWQQAIYTHALGAAVKLQGRARLEQRFGAGDEVGNRLRVFGRAQWAPDPAIALQLVAWDELFVQLDDTDWGPVAGFDQNRAFAGLGVDAGLRGVRFELGYTNVALRGDRMDHVVAANVFVTIAPRKMK